MFVVLVKKAPHRQKIEQLLIPLSRNEVFILHNQRRRNEIRSEGADRAPKARISRGAGYVPQKFFKNRALRNMFSCILGTDFKAFGCKNWSHRVVKNLRYQTLF